MSIDPAQTILYRFTSFVHKFDVFIKSGHRPASFTCAASGLSGTSVRSFALSCLGAAATWPLLDVSRPQLAHVDFLSLAYALPGQSSIVDESALCHSLGCSSRGAP